MGHHGPMRYWQSSPQRGLPLLLIHGYGAMIEYWNAVLPTLAERHTCYLLDLYGFGYSADLKTRPNKRMWANQVASFIHKVIPEPAILIGHSLGGTMSAQMALDYPQFVRGLVLVDSTGVPGTGPLYTHHERAFHKLVQAPMVGELIATAIGGRVGVTQFLYNLYYRKERVRSEVIDILSGPLRKPGSGSFSAERPTGIR
ncbi:MAG: alpha/beta fold hydrolase [Chloroflexaceae bacterium]|nr:alpha/beta fold hydrolase [Chloroflexaceae bacterium]